MKRISENRTADQVAVSAALAAAEKAVAAALTAAKEAVSKAEISQQRTNEGQNEFRAQLKDQASTLMPRAEYRLANDSLHDELGRLRDDFNELRTQVMMGPPEVKTLMAGSNQQSGRTEQSKNDRQLLFAVIGLALGILGAFGYALAFVKP